jgi:hypothetical protein
MSIITTRLDHSTSTTSEMTLIDLNSSGFEPFSFYFFTAVRAIITVFGLQYGLLDRGLKWMERGRLEGY